ncbi:M20 family metallopeptidase [Ruoffia tabacinasalis]|uniref:M20 family metallopeptidase n=1 Tax=Ruoffia tabacinasalis TaxID=87458 RepID=A0ABS0LMW2_9LACT|nr:M20 family metallopeptidase [Ruoffia tabacinasalis]MBG9978749.1 M20 family metallopeptidase [Ruoffia tabacinasalis]
MTNIYKEKQGEIEELLEELVNIDSGSYYKQGVDAVGNVLKQEFENIGMSVTVHPLEDRGDILQIQHPNAKKPDILLSGHMDTVFPEGTVKMRPFKIKGEYAYGPGVFDMKGSLVMLLYAMRALIQEGHPVVERIVIILNTDEEIGSIDSRSLIETFASQATSVLVIEPSSVPGIINSRKGGGKFFLDIHGKSAHAGAEPEKGCSAIEEAAHKILHLHKLSDNPGINVNVGLISGGTSINTIAPTSVAAIDLRFEANELGVFAEQEIRKICLHPVLEGITLNLRGKITRPAWVAPQNNGRLEQTFIQSGKKMGLTLPLLYSGGGSDGNFTGSMGVPTIDGLGPSGGDAHQETEYLYLPSIHTKGQLFINGLKELAVTKELIGGLQ